MHHENAQVKVKKDISKTGPKPRCSSSPAPYLYIPWDLNMKVILVFHISELPTLHKESQLF